MFKSENELMIPQNNLPFDFFYFNYNLTVYNLTLLKTLKILRRPEKCSILFLKIQYREGYAMTRPNFGQNFVVLHENFVNRSK